MLPGLLLLIGMLPFWRRLREMHWVKAGIGGANAAMVGLLAAALYTPAWITSVGKPAVLCAALAAFVLLLTVWQALQQGAAALLGR